jgi:hypothetical protein
MNKREIIRYMEKNTKLLEGINKYKVSIFELTEFDQWVNEATREDLRMLYDLTNGDIFAIDYDLKEIIEDKDMILNAKNFSIRAIYLNKDKEKVKELLKKRDKIDLRKFLDKILGLSVYCCLWV